MKNLVLISFLLFSVQAMASIDKTKSRIEWTGTKVTGKHTGTFSIKTSDVTVKKGKVTPGKIVVDINSLNVTDLSGELKAKLEGHLKNKDFFEVTKFPTATFVIENDNGKQLEGKMIIKGVTQKVKIPYTKKGKVYTGTFELDRTKYNLKYGSGSFFKGLGDKVIHDKVTLKFNMVFK